LQKEERGLHHRRTLIGTVYIRRWKAVEEDFGRDFVRKGEDRINDAIQLVLDGLPGILE
jgi:hypothetical protein